MKKAVSILLAVIFCSSTYAQRTGSGRNVCKSNNGIK